MSDYTGPSIDPTNPNLALQAITRLIRQQDFKNANLLIGWALDFNPEHGGLMRQLSDIRWAEGKIEESIEWANRALAADPGDAAGYAHLGKLCVWQGRYANAAEVLGRAVEITPDSKVYLRRLSDIMMHLGRREDALALAERAATLTPPDVQSYFALASLQQRYGYFDDAEASISKAVDLAPDNATTLRRIAEFQLSHGNLTGGQLLADRAREIDPEDPANYDFQARLATAAGDTAAAEAALAHAVTLNLAGAHHKRRLSDALMRRGDWDGAFNWAKQAIASHPADLFNYYHLANLHNRQGRPDEAYLILENAVAQAAKPADAVFLMRRLSQMAQQKGADAEALAWAERALAADAYDAENHGQVASIYLQQKKLTEARLAAERAAELAPGNPAHLRRLSDIAWQSGDTRTALDKVAMAITLHPTDAASYMHQATLLTRAEKHEAAELPLLRALELLPEDISLLMRLSALKMRLGKADEAFALADRVIAARPQEATGYNHLATLHLGRNDLAGADAALNQAVALEPTNVPLLRRLADVALRRGEEAEALTWLQRALKANAEDPQIHDQLASVHLARGDQAGAEAALTQAALFAGRNPNFHGRLSSILKIRGDEHGALHWANRMVEDFPFDPAGFMQLGLLHLEANRPGEAEAAFIKAHGLAKTPAQIVAPLQRLSDLATQRQDIAAALAWATKAVQQAPHEAAAYGNLATLHLNFGNLPAAQAAAQTAVELAPTNIKALICYGEICLKRGKAGLALDLANRAIIVNQTNPMGHYQKARAQLANNDISSANISVEQALKLAPKNPGILRLANYLRGLIPAPA